MSYDQSVDSAFVFDCSIKQSNQSLYQYDGSSGTYNVDQYTGYSNIYKVQDEDYDQYLNQVTLDAYCENEPYTIKVYNNLTNNDDPTSGKLVLTQKGTVVYPGYQTIDFDHTTKLKEGSYYSIVLEVNKDFALFADETYTNGDWIRFTANQDNELDFYQQEGTWKQSKEFTPRLKALTTTRTDMSNGTVSGVTDATYTGEAITQDSVIVKFNGETLTQGTDYTLGYYNNTDAGTATLRIFGQGIYGGELDQTFTIHPKEISSLKANVDNATYTGSTLEPKVTCDFTYKAAYYNNINQGKGIVILEGTGNYTGKQTLDFSIYARDINEATLTGLSDTTYNKRYQTLPITALYNNNAASISVAYKDHRDPGIATVYITGTDNFSGTMVRTFKIKPMKNKIKVVRSIGKKKLYVKYTSTPKVAGYEIAYCKKGTSTWTKKTTKSLSKKVSGLKRRTDYYIKMRSFVTATQGNLYSAYSSAKKVRIR